MEKWEFEFAQIPIFHSIEAVLSQPLLFFFYRARHDDLPENLLIVPHPIEGTECRKNINVGSIITILSTLSILLHKIQIVKKYRRLNDYASVSSKVFSAK